MKILFINQYYWPDMAATSQILQDLTLHLNSYSKHEIQVLCAKGSYNKNSSDQATKQTNTDTHPIKIHRLWCTNFGKRSILGSLIDYLTFHLGVFVWLSCHWFKYQLVISLTTPPWIGFQAALFAKFTKLKTINWIMDLHPESEIGLGMIKPKSLLAKLLLRANRFIYRHASGNVVLGKYMAKRIVDAGADPKKVHVIPVWSQPLKEPLDGQTLEDFKQVRGLTSKFIVMYSGNAGLLHTFDEIKEAAKILANQPQIAFVFVGGGPAIDEIKAFAKTHQLTNIHFHPYVPRDQLASSLKAADVHLVTLKKGMEGIAVPSKLYGMMAAGRPAIFVGPSACEPAEAIKEHGFGRVVQLGDAAELAEAILTLYHDRTLGEQYGKLAKDAFEHYYLPQIHLEKWQQLIDAL